MFQKCCSKSVLVFFSNFETIYIKKEYIDALTTNIMPYTKENIYNIHKNNKMKL